MTSLGTRAGVASCFLGMRSLRDREDPGGTGVLTLPEIDVGDRDCELHRVARLEDMCNVLHADGALARHHVDNLRAWVFMRLCLAVCC